MKTVKIKLLPIVVLLIGMGTIYSCGSTKKLTRGQKHDYGEEQYQVCSEEAEEFGEENYFMGIGEGKSLNSQYSKKMARTEARNDLAEKMNTFVLEDIKNNEEQSGDPETYKAAWETKGQQLVSQKLQGLSVFCEKTFKNDQGLYTSFVGVKLDVEKKVFLKQIKSELLQ